MILVAGEIETTTKGGSSVEETTTVENNYTVNSKLPQHMVTGYWHNFLNGSDEHWKDFRCSKLL